MDHKTRGKVIEYEIHSIYQNINSEQTNVVLGKQNRLLWGEPTITDQIGKVSFSISPHSWTGSIGLYLVDQVKRVIGIEVVADAAEETKKNAANNGISHANYLVGKAKK